MNLYVWEEVFCEWTHGVAFALANTPDEAREKVVASVNESLRDIARLEVSKEPTVWPLGKGYHLWGGA